MDFNYSMTENGQYISFLSDATNLVRGVRIPRCNPAFYLVEDTGGGTHCTQTYLWHANTVRLVSVRTTGDPGTGHSTATDVSDDGRYVAFSAEDAGYQKQYKVPAGQDMYIRDMKTGKTTLECLSSSGSAGDRACVAFAPYTGQFMSADARYIVFESSSTNLSSQSPKSTKVIAFYVRDRQAGTTVRVDVANDGAPGAGGPLPSVGSIVISADGRWIAFISSATNLDAQSKQGHQEVYLRDGVTGSLSLASTSTTGTAGDGDSFSPTLTRDGSLVAFESTSGNLVTHDANAHECPADVGTNCSNVYLHTNVGAAS
jgi:Tol biopolymer transport system component